MFSEDLEHQTSLLFKVLSNPKARLILSVLADSIDPLSVSTISETSKVDYSSTVKLSKILHSLQIIYATRKGKFTLYEFNKKSELKSIASLINNHFDRINEWI